MKIQLIILMYMSILLMLLISITLAEIDNGNSNVKNATLNTSLNRTNESAIVITNVTTNVVPSVNINIQTVNIFLITNMTEVIEMLSQNYE